MGFPQIAQVSKREMEHVIKAGVTSVGFSGFIFSWVTAPSKFGLNPENCVK